MNNTETLFQPVSEQSTESSVDSTSTSQKTWMKMIFLLSIIISALISLVAGIQIGKQQHANNNDQNVTETNQSPISAELGSEDLDISSWLPYRNHTSGYQFQYPSDFSLVSNSPDLVSISNDLPSDPSCIGGGCNLGTKQLTMTFVHSSNQFGLSLDEIAQNHKDSLLNRFPDQTIVLKAVRKFGSDARYFESAGLGYFESYVVKPTPDTSLFVEVGYPSKEKSADFRAVAEKILTTVVFTQPMSEGEDAESLLSSWNTYSNSVLNYTIQYPDGWAVDAAKAELPSGQILVISNGDYDLTIQWPSAYGPWMCLFDDHDRTTAPEFASYCEGDFKEFESGNGKIIYRRLEAPDILEKSAQWRVFAKEEKYFVTVPPISYHSPINFKKQMIETLDQILSSYHSNN